MSKGYVPAETAEYSKEVAAELAEIDGFSLNQFITSAVAEKVGTLRTASG